MNELLLQGLSELGLDVSRAETLERFSSLLLEKNEVMNLTAITEPDAVAQLSVLSELCLPLVKVGGQFAAMKSVDTEDEIAAAKSAIRTLGGRIVKVEDYKIPTSDVVHRLVLIEKVSPTPRAYPRAFAKIKKAPL